MDERDVAELEWWRQSFVCRFGPNNLPHVGDALFGYRFHLFFDHPDDGLIKWEARPKRRLAQTDRSMRHGTPA